MLRKETPNVCIRYTHHDPNIPYVNTIGPRSIKYDLQCSIDVRLNIIDVRLLSKGGFAKVAKDWATGLLGPLKPSRLIDHPISIFNSWPRSFKESRSPRTSNAPGLLVVIVSR